MNRHYVRAVLAYRVSDDGKKPIAMSDSLHISNVQTKVAEHKSWWNQCVKADGYTSSSVHSNVLKETLSGYGNFGHVLVCGFFTDHISKGVVQGMVMLSVMFVCLAMRGPISRCTGTDRKEDQQEGSSGKESTRPSTSRKDRPGRFGSEGLIRKEGSSIRPESFTHL